MIIDIYETTLGLHNELVYNTRIKYICPDCSKQSATNYGSYIKYKYEGLCRKCIYKQKKKESAKE